MFIVDKGYEYFNAPEKEFHEFSKNAEANKYLNDIKNYPHIFVLACCMDRQINSKKSWEIPYKVCKEIGSFEMKDLVVKSEKFYIDLFKTQKYHRYNEKMGSAFYNCVQDIHNKYNDDASKIWKNKPSSATVVYRFLEFKEVGLKIATMSTNILAREFKIKFKDYYSIDVSPDVHIKRVLPRMGFLPKGSDNEKIIYKARELNPEFPGIIDSVCWEIGTTYCHKTNPDCANCIAKAECKKLI